MTTTGSVERVEVLVAGKPVRVVCGGTGTALLLVHGGWGGAELHWARVWGALAQRHRVIAPDLPGLGAVEQPALSTVADYARWLVQLLDALSVERACCVGNSFGASVVWSLAGRWPDRCSGLVLVNGFPMPATPPLLRRLGRVSLLEWLMRRVVSRWIYTARNVPRAFAKPESIPADFERVMAQEWPILVPRYVRLLVEGDGAPTPSLAPLLLWGASDRLPGTRDGHDWQKRLEGSTLRAIANAGHFPQLDAPDEFVAALEAFLPRG